MEDSSLEVCVRAADADDTEAIDELIVYLDKFHAEARPDLFRTPFGTPRGDDFLQTVLEDPEQQMLVATRAGKVVGFAHVLTKNTTSSSHRLGRRYSDIDTMSVHPIAQRLGVGGRLIEAALSWAEAKGIRDHQIAVHEFNGPARALYEKLGFTPSIIVLRRKN